jgi:hypothetical protein
VVFKAPWEFWVDYHASSTRGHVKTFFTFLFYFYVAPAVLNAEITDVAPKRSIFHLPPYINLSISKLLPPIELEHELVNHGFRLYLLQDRQRYSPVPDDARFRTNCQPNYPYTLGELPCMKLFESSRVLAFLDIQPLSRGHAVRPVLALLLQPSPGGSVVPCDCTRVRDRLLIDPGTNLSISPPSSSSFPNPTARN